MCASTAGVLFEGDTGKPLPAAAETPKLHGLRDPWVDAERIHQATDPARQRQLAAERPPHLPRAADLRPKLLLVSSQDIYCTVHSCMQRAKSKSEAG